MTSKLTIPIISEVIEMTEVTGIKSFVGRNMEKSVKFMGQDLKIKKLLVAEVLAIQAKAKELKLDDNSDKSDSDGLDLLKLVIRSAAENGQALTDEDFQQFPIDELSKLSEEIMRFSGLGNEPKKQS